MRCLRFVSASLGLLLAASCEAPSSPTLALPPGLQLAALPAEQRALLRVTLEVSDGALNETDLVLARDVQSVSGTFTLQNAASGSRTATLRVYGRFNADADEVLLGRATDTATVQTATTTHFDFADTAFETCAAGLDGRCTLEFDLNRNGVSNMLDLAPRTVDGGLGIDPAPQPSFIEASPETLQFASGIRLGQFARQVIVLENVGDNPITFDAIEVGGGQGVMLSLFDPFGGPVDRPRRALPADEINTIVAPGDEFLLAVSFAPVNAFLTTAGVQVLARDTVTGVVQATRVKIIANADGTLRPRPTDYVSPDIGATLDVGSGSIPVTAFPAEELFSGQEIASGLNRAGAALVVTAEAQTTTMPADRGFVIDVPAATRLAVGLSGLVTDVDLAIVALDADNAVDRLLAVSQHPSTGAEGIDIVNDGEAPMRVVVLLGRVEVGVAPIEAAALGADEPVPFQLSCELSRGPEFSDDDALVPSSGPLEGGTPFTLRGRGFQPGAIVSFADFRALDVVITIDPDSGDSIATGLMPPGSLEVGKNPATAVVANPPIDAGGDGQAATLPEAFLYDPPAARVDVVLPDVAPVGGLDEPITILGNFFSDASGPPRVNFGDTISVDATFVSATELRVPVSAAPAGTVVLTVSNQIDTGVYGARSNGVAFRFAEPTGPAPRISTVSPARGAADGGDTITIAGSGFAAGSRVLFGTVEAAVVTAEENNITVRSPVVDIDGNVSISVVNPDGQSTRAIDAFNYFFPAPRVDALLPSRIPTTGGTLIIVTGQSLRAGVTAVLRVDGRDIPPLSTVRTASTTVLVTTPPLPAAGEAVLVFTNPDGQQATSPPLEVFEPQGVGPTIVFVEPATGPLQGRNLITVAGRDFDEDGVKVVLAGTTFQLSVDKGGAAGFDRVEFAAPPVLTPGTQPLVLENGDGQSTVTSYLYVEVDTARIDQVLPAALHILPRNEVQILGEFFSTFGSQLQVTLGAGADTQTLPLVARSDGLLVARVPARIGTAGLRAIAVTDGVTTVSATVNVVEPRIDSVEERGDELELVGAHLAGTRLQTLCAGADAYRPGVADDDVLVVRRDGRNDARCAGRTGRALQLRYDNGAELFETGVSVQDEADADGDGVGAADDPDDDAPCVPNIIAAVCDFDGDGLTNAVDSAGQDPCVPSTNAVTCTRDTDGDGVLDPVDAADADACVPNSNALTCTADADGDGVINPFDPADSDTCVPNAASTACTIDSDNDGVTDPFDPVDSNACVPNTTATTCDADADGVFPPLDTDNVDACVPDQQDPLCGNDDDSDGTINALDTDDADGCVPNREALVCAADDDNDGVVNPFDPTDNDACIPNAAAATCTIDSDNDGVTNPFDPVDNNACIPNTTATVCDADGDGVFPPTDVSNQDPCVPDANDPLCTADDDRDGIANAADADDANACIPNSEALTCSADADGDGIVNPFDPADADPCAPNPASSACISDSDGDGVTDAFDPVDDNACVPNTAATTCDADGDGVLPPVDVDNEDPCTPNSEDVLCTDDDDGDGTVNAADADDGNACVPNSNALACTADDDGDGVVNPFDPDDANGCAPNPASIACAADADNDGVTDAFDPVDTNACIPNTTATTCDADGDGLLPPGDGANTDPCVPNNQHPLCTDDDDGDGIVNASDGNDSNACIPNNNALACTADDDGDGVINPFDPADADACTPNAAAAACTADADGDGVGDAFDPVDTNPCVPNSTALNCDADSDGVLPPTDTANQDPCIPDSNDVLCTSDDDRDGVLNPFDSNDANGCIPDSEALVCTADTDGDGVINPFDPADADPCSPNAASSACTADADADGVTDPFDPVDTNTCIPNINAVTCDNDGDGSFPPADTNNSNACLPNNQHPLCTADDDADGVLNPVDSNDANPCIPNSNALTCAQDDDGDGVPNPFDGNDIDGCVPNPAATACVVCGDGFKRGAEACDDGNLVANDGCSASCTVETGFTCNGSPSSCNDVCGDGVKSTREDCDDGARIPGDGCNPDCELEFCGDGIVSGNSGASSITFRWLSTNCPPGTPGQIVFTINGVTALDTIADAGTCTCTPGINSQTVTDPTVLSAIVDGDNTFTVAALGTEHHFAWATATVVTASSSTIFTVGDEGGGNDGLNNNSDLCNALQDINLSFTTTQALDGGEGCDDGDNVSGDGCSASCFVEPGFECTAGSPSRCSTLPVRASCLAHRLAGASTNGLYVIDPDGAGSITSSTVFCDMLTDGGGYTFFKVQQTLQGDAAEAFCASRGMHLLIPRTQAHFQRSVQIALDPAIGPSGGPEYARIFGVFPDFVGANCQNQPLNSANTSCPWHARDNNAYFIHNTTIFGEPSGDNCLDCSMDYSYDAAGNLSGFNDFPAQPTATAFICDVGDKF